MQVGWKTWLIKERKKEVKKDMERATRIICQCLKTVALKVLSDSQ